MDRAFEVVAVDLGCFDRALVRGEPGLHAVPDFGRDQRRVVALVAGASIDHVALVVRVRKHAVDAGHGGLAGPFGVGRLQPAR